MNAPSILPEIKKDEQILFNKNNSMFVGRIVEVTEKAVKVDYYWQPIMCTLFGVEVFNYSTWMPKSVLISVKETISVKGWFANNFAGGHNIKKYFIENGNTVFI